MVLLDYTLMGKGIAKIDESLKDVLKKFEDHGYECEYDPFNKCYWVKNSCLMIYEED